MRTYLPGESEELLSEGWTLTLTPADACETPSDIPASLQGLHVSVPGTVAQALEAAEKFDRLAPEPLNDRDAWYRLTMISDTRERATLRFDGLSTIAEIFFNGGDRRKPEHVRKAGSACRTNGRRRTFDLLPGACAET